MNRRDFLKLTAALTGAVALNACGAFEDGDEDILIVGAGIAGLERCPNAQKMGLSRHHS